MLIDLIEGKYHLSIDGQPIQKLTDENKHKLDKVLDDILEYVKKIEDDK
jgi:hypothetical protein